MKVQDLKNQYAHLPHVKKVWVKNGNVYTSPVHQAECIDLTKETTLQDAPAENELAQNAKPKKNK